MQRALYVHNTMWHYAGLKHDLELANRAGEVLEDPSASLLFAGEQTLDDAVGQIIGLYNSRGRTTQGGAVW